jgi:CrcB protein
MKLLLIIGSGGFLGSIARYLLSHLITEKNESPFPWGTLVVNLLGCFLIGLVFGIAAKTQSMHPEVRMFLTVGVLGGFTTFSAFANENFILMKEGQIMYAALYAAVSVFVGVLLAYVGHMLPKLF